MADHHGDHCSPSSLAAAALATLPLADDRRVDRSPDRLTAVATDLAAERDALTADLDQRAAISPRPSSPARLRTTSPHSPRKAKQPTSVRVARLVAGDVSRRRATSSKSASAVRGELITARRTFEAYDPASYRVHAEVADCIQTGARRQAGDQAAGWGSNEIAALGAAMRGALSQWLGEDLPGCHDAGPGRDRRDRRRPRRTRHTTTLTDGFRTRARCRPRSPASVSRRREHREAGSRCPRTSWSPTGTWWSGLDACG